MSIPKELKALIFLRDKNICTVCKLATDKLTIHHIKPKSKGGTDIPENLTTVCLYCHRRIHKLEKGGNKDGFKKEKRRWRRKKI